MAGWYLVFSEFTSKPMSLLAFMKISAFSPTQRFDYTSTKFYENRWSSFSEKKPLIKNQNIQNQNIVIWNLSFENVEKFRYLGVIVTNTNGIREEIKRWINMGNACYCSLEKILSSPSAFQEIES